MTLFPLRSVLALSLLFSMAACTDGADGKDGETGEMPGDEVCDNDADDDADGSVDCDDTDCADDPACVAATVETACADGLDDDGDGAVDCEDTDCADDAACQEVTEEVLCDDGADDDGDGAIDCADSDCADDPACAASVESICDDTLDNDGDGATDCDDSDCAADPACATASETLCDDGLDDDGDGAIDCDDEDCAADPACALAAELSCGDGLDDDGDGAIDCADADCAADASCSGGVSELVCGDGLDDDGDGLVDCDDAECADTGTCVAAECGATDLGMAIGAAVATGTTSGAGDDSTPGCVEGGGEDVTYTWTAPVSGEFRISTMGSAFDTVVSLRTDDCTTEIDCDDDGGGEPYSEIRFSAVAGEVFVISLDGASAADTGTFQLNVDPLFELDCDDGGDEDLDGLLDCADTDCAADPACGAERCDDGTDDDLDGAVDCADTDCLSDAACMATCVDAVLGSAVGDAVATGTTAGEDDDFGGSCAGGSAGDVAYLWTAPATGTYTFDTAGSAFDTVLIAREPDCSGTELSCHDSVDGTDTSSAITLSLAIGQSVTLVVDGVDGASGRYVLNVGASAETVCDDEVDEDADGYLDCDDLDCLGHSACRPPETVCSDGVDEDGDAAADCLDDDCAADPLCDASAADVHLGSARPATATGTTVGGGDDATPSCVASSAEDVVYAWIAPMTDEWTFELTGSSFDTAIYLLTAEGTELVCADDGAGDGAARASAMLNAGQLVLVVVDGAGSASGDYALLID